MFERTAVRLEIPQQPLLGLERSAIIVADLERLVRDPAACLKLRNVRATAVPRPRTDPGSGGVTVTSAAKRGSSGGP